MNKNLADMTPVEIDTILAPLWDRQAEAKMRIANYKRAESEIHATIEKIKSGVQVSRYRTVLDGIELMEKLAMLGRHIVAEGDKLALLEMESLPYETEYTRRGGWTRVFLAKSNNGHAHNGTECSTCHHGEYRTDFAWLVQYSGKPEAEIVADAGERACTTCYPSAPVNAKGTKMFTPDEIEAQKAREEREAERARKAKEAADKSITTPEGGKVITSRHYMDVAKTLRTAEIAATDALYDLIREQQHSVDPEWAWFYEGGRRTTEQEQAEHAYLAWHLIRSIAFKKGLSFQEVFETHEKKAQAKIKKVDREWAKDPRNPNRVK
jgi:hypothetical protein